MNRRKHTKTKNMTLVFVKISLGVVDEFKGFFAKLKEFIGDFRIEGQDVYDVDKKVIKVSFYTDKIEIKEGESRQVEIHAASSPDGSWEFTGIEK